MTSTEVPAIQTIVAGVDGSDPSIRALEWAAKLAELAGASLEVIATWEWPINYGWALPIPPDYDPAADAERLLEAATATIRSVHPSLVVRTTVTEGRPAPVLVEASRAADLLVVGSRGHGEFAGMLLGSVSEHCVTNAHCPVLVFREAL